MFYQRFRAFLAGSCLSLALTLLPSCWLGHDYSNCESADDCSSVQICIDGLCTLLPGVSACNPNSPTNTCPTGTVCDPTLAACVTDGSAGDIGSDTGDADDDISPDLDDDSANDATADVGDDADADLDQGDDDDVNVDTSDDANTDLGDDDLGNDDVDLDGGLSAPQNVSASDGTAPNFVTITWSPVAGATSYRVLRNGSEVGTPSATSYADDTAEAFAPTATGLNLAVAAETDQHVRLTWQEPFVAPGTTYAYSVVAVNGAVESVPSATDDGHRGAAPVTSYALGRADTWSDIGNVTVINDTAAPAGSMTAVGTATASEDSIYGVELELTGTTTVAGSVLEYRIRAVNVVGSGGESGAVSGQRNAPTVSIQWQRSADDSDDFYADVPAGVVASFVEYNGPIDVQVRYYRAVVTPSVGEPVTSTPVSGHRVLAEVVGGELGSRDVAISGDWAVISERDCAAFMHFEQPEWIRRFYPCSGDVDDSSHGAIDDDWAVVGFDEGDLGVVVYNLGEGSTWVVDTTLLNSDTEPLDAFGITVAISGSRILVGAQDHGDSGAAYWYDRNSEGDWIESSFPSPSSQDNARFGGSVAIAGSYGLVGGDGEVFLYEDSGSGFEFVQELGWVELEADGDGMGRVGTIALTAEYVVLGAPNYNDSSGVVVVVAESEPGTWSPISQLFQTAEATFGGNVTANGAQFAISYGTSGDGGPEAYLYRRSESGMPVLDTIFSVNPTPDDFGAEIAMSDEWIVASDGADPYFFYVGNRD